MVFWYKESKWVFPWGFKFFQIFGSPRTINSRFVQFKGLMYRKTIFPTHIISHKLKNKILKTYNYKFHFSCILFYIAVNFKFLNFSGYIHIILKFDVGLKAIIPHLEIFNIKLFSYKMLIKFKRMLLLWKTYIKKSYKTKQKLIFFHLIKKNGDLIFSFLF